MGTLKAGATFSVIDPAYPPDRQIIYLDVARPRALISIAKAKGGGLPPSVDEWVRQNLSLKAFVPQLQVHDGGKITGGASDASGDIFDHVQSSSSSLPDAIVGPDSNPTLSFTSGSEGRPKGVLGRHFSLVHYFPWMGEMFGLSENDRFTMLSGISHDPIQRDIFTPLFFGAQLYVPSAEDIQHEKLAEWMKKYQTTVTHLTPAMGQILVGGATTQFVDLRNAFFVGDILIKRDVRRLQDLAPNARVVNMFGTTETQRAVSYFAIPPQNMQADFLNNLGDRIPAGKGMNNVQMLVVDRENKRRLCDVGEQGEIYVRAAGLAEGYMGLEDVTRQKFIPSWFVDKDHWPDQENAGSGPWRKYYMGPRDRLYRSGDLGHYTESGDVECTGRIDNQVKIRGFRVELGEIDTHLSHHPIVRENVTMTRRDKDEEHMLVSYIVPEMSRWPSWLKEHGLTDEEQDSSMPGMLKRFSALRDGVREYLKTKVPVYAVPSIVIPLDRMPLNPNGKVDKPALPFPNPSELGTALPRRPSVNVSTRTKTEQQLAQVWATVLNGVPSKTIGSEDSFFDLGAHSLTSQKLMLSVRKTWGDIDVSMQSLYDYPSLRGFAAEIDRALDPQGRVLDFEDHPEGAPTRQDTHYSLDAQHLASELPGAFETRRLEVDSPLTVLVTGATGFLGAYITHSLLSRNAPSIHVIALVRAKTDEQAHERVRSSLAAYQLWDDTFTTRIESVAGDTALPQLGLDDLHWEKLKNRTDLIIANAAKVHWLQTYQQLRGPNVLSLMTLMELAANGVPKRLTFISSTSAVDTDYYLQLSDEIVASGGQGIPESDDLHGAQRGLANGYGQTKWAGEYLMREARRRGLAATTVRPGYVLGDSATGASITDDFLIRLLKACVQQRARPDIQNTINMVPVDTVSKAIVAASLRPAHSATDHANINARPRMTFSQFLENLELFGYDAPQVPYKSWRDQMETWIFGDDPAGREEHALLPLASWVLADLPGSTKAPELGIENTLAALRADSNSLSGIDGSRVAVEPSRRMRVTEEDVGRYLAYLVAIGFIPAPEPGRGSRALPHLDLSPDQVKEARRVGGRGAVTG
ncbi:MAG: hypothetical protein Q9162_001521 [Coniocarpon cinnabarinum]